MSGFRRTSIALCLASSSLALGCAREPAQSPSDLASLEKHPEQLLERVAWLRQLPQLRSTRFAFHGPAEVRELVESQAGEAEAPTSADHPAFQHAFGFSGAGGRL